MGDRVWGRIMHRSKYLLATTAAFLVVAVGQAQGETRERMRAERVDYVKICSLYGDGFYYIPGTDTCLRFGGMVQFDYALNVGVAHTPQYFGGGGAQDRSVSSFSSRHRLEFSLDSRTATQYGALRTYSSFYAQNEHGEDSTNTRRAFIQWAGFTFGRVKSLSDVVGLNDDRLGNYHNVPNMSGTGENGNNEISYTWELGSGSALHVGAGERRVKPIANLSNDVWNASSNPMPSIHGQQYPNPYAAFKVSQAWGRWDVSVTANSVQSTYYTAAPGVPGYTPGTACASQSGTTWCDRPSDTWGWAVISGVEINTPW